MRDADRAPELAVAQWFNTPRPLTLAGLRGRPVLLHAFQMLCPGCVATALPQAERAHRLFRDTDLQVIGLHTVFEHHAAMPPVALEAFLQEYRLTFPVGVDTPGDRDPVPETMRRYGFRGTPSLVLIGRDGRIRHHGFGGEDDMALGARIATALGEAPVAAAAAVDGDDCADGVCRPRSDAGSRAAAG
jgi:peroxiredoxin